MIGVDLSADAGTDINVGVGTDVNANVYSNVDFPAVVVDEVVALGADEA